MLPDQSCSWCGLAIAPSFPERSVRLTNDEARRREQRTPRYGMTGVLAAAGAGFAEALRHHLDEAPPLVIDWRFHRDCLDKLARIIEDRV